MAPPRSRAPARQRPVAEAPPANHNAAPCNVQADAIDRQTDAIRDLIAEFARGQDELKAMRVAFKPAADAIHSLGDAQVKLCNFLVNNRLKLVAGLIATLVAVGAISPNAATVLGAILKNVGLS
jgi:hypothetical protein